MLHVSLFRSTPFRLALAFALLFVCAFLLSGFVTFDLIRKELNARYDNRTRELFHVISQTYADSDVQDLIDATSVHIAATSQKRSVFLLRGADGRVLASNIPVVPVPDGWSEKSGASFGIPGNYTYRLYAGKVGPNKLVIGTSNEETSELQEIIIASFAWASIVVFAFALTGGVLIAFRAQRRLDAVRDTMSRVSHGELAARIPLLGKGDDLDQLSRDINDALERLSASVEGLRQVSSDIAHDLKTPLNHLKITLEDAREKQERGAVVAEELDYALGEADKINQTFEALLRIAQIESGARKSRFAQINLNEIYESLADAYGDVAEDAGHTLVRDFYSGGSSTISGDRDLLMQMYANLIENAIRYCPVDSVIRLKVAMHDGRIFTSIEDNGLGIPEDEYEKVFRRLYRVEKSRTSPGTGLGLSLVKAIADLHGAAIRLENAGPGLRVVITYG